MAVGLVVVATFLLAGMGREQQESSVSQFADATPRGEVRNRELVIGAGDRVVPDASVVVDLASRDGGAFERTRREAADSHDW